MPYADECGQLTGVLHLRVGHGRGEAGDSYGPVAEGIVGRCGNECAINASREGDKQRMHLPQ